jgi:hypothetical protein
VPAEALKLAWQQHYHLRSSDVICPDSIEFSMVFEKNLNQSFLCMNNFSSVSSWAGTSWTCENMEVFKKMGDHLTS